MATKPKLPPELDLSVYRAAYKDLVKFTDAELEQHYHMFGQAEGRSGNGLKQRTQFVSLIPAASKSLEIGPFAAPMLTGPNVAYCDVADQIALKKRAVALKLDPDRVPKIDFVLGPGGLEDIKADFDSVVSSHSIEHQPDLISHLQQVQRLLKVRRGRYFLLVPDKRYCFDRFQSESTIADVLDAHHSGRKVHSLKSVIEHRVLVTHNDSAEHWKVPDLRRGKPDPNTMKAAVAEWKAANGGYIDVHAWVFTPQSFKEIIETLNDAGYVSLALERLYPTRRGNNEFWAVLSTV